MARYRSKNQIMKKFKLKTKYFRNDKMKLQKLDLRTNNYPRLIFSDNLSIQSYLDYRSLKQFMSTEFKESMRYLQRTIDHRNCSYSPFNQTWPLAHCINTQYVTMTQTASNIDWTMTINNMIHTNTTGY